MKVRNKKKVESRNVFFCINYLYYKLDHEKPGGCFYNVHVCINQIVGVCFRFKNCKVQTIT